jgi:hypothetical protein
MKDMRNALNLIRSTVRLTRRRRRMNTNGLRVHSGIGVRIRVQRSSISPLSILRTKFIDPDYTITFIRGAKHTPATSSRTKHTVWEAPAPTAVDNAEKMGIISRIPPSSLQIR